MSEDLPPIPDGYEEVEPENVDGDCLAFDPFTDNDTELWSFRIVTNESIRDLSHVDYDGREAHYDVYQHGGYLNRKVPIDDSHNIRFVRPIEDEANEE